MSMRRVFCILLVLALLALTAAGAEEAPRVIGGADGPTSVFVAEAGVEDRSESVAVIGGADGPTDIAVAQPDAAQTPEATPDYEFVAIEGEVQIAEITPDPTPEATPSPEPTEAPRLAGVIIGIDPGHQAHANNDFEPIAPGSDEMKAKVSSGTSGASTGIAEYVTDLEIGLKLRDALEAQGATVYMTRETNDVDISNLERAQMMNQLQADLVLRIHCDGAEDSSANGIGMFVRETGEKQAESQAAAEMLLDAMVEATGARRRSVYLRDTYTMNNWSTVPCILVECGFMSNPEEDEKLNDPAYQDLLVQGMVEGICRYFPEGWGLEKAAAMANATPAPTIDATATPEPSPSATPTPEPTLGPASEDALE